MQDLDKHQRWRLILGQTQTEDSLPEELMGMDQTLAQLYEQAENPGKGGLGNSNPQVNRWLGDIRRYFPSSIVQVLQKDAMQRLGLDRMLLEPELLSSLQPDVSLVATLLSLSKVIPQKTKETARQVVQQVVNQTLQRLKLPTEQAIRGALSRRSRNRRPKLHEIDWGRTIRQNLKHYQPSHHTLVPEQLIGHGRRQQRLKDLILCVDQSGSMASSVVYASIFGAVLASLPALKTHFIAFDTQVTELTAHLHDPVDLLFGTQLGGGTDIHKALSYAQSLIARPSDTVLVLITDLYEGGHAQPLLQKIQQLQQNEVKILILLALNDEGSPAYDRQMAERIGQWGIPVLACTPDAFPSLLGQYLS